MHGAKKLLQWLSGIVIVVIAVAATDVSTFAQPSRELAVPEQPGRVPDPSEEVLPSALQRQVVFYRTNEPVGTVIIDTVYRYLYLVQPNSRAIRYGIGIGREGCEWQGLLRVSRTAQATAVPTAIAAGRSWQSERSARAASGRRLPNSRHQSAADDRPCRLFRMLSAHKQRRHRLVRPGARRRQSGREAKSDFLRHRAAAR
jgi:hypothetical protein